MKKVASTSMVLMLITLIGAAFVGVFPRPALAASAAYSLGDLSLQNGWDSGIAGTGFANNIANSDVVTNALALTGTQSWRYSGSYGSPGAGTPSTPYVATVGAPNAASAFGGLLNSPVTPAGDRSVISFAFKAIAPGDGSQIKVSEGNRDTPANGNRTGSFFQMDATPTGVKLSFSHLSSTDSCGTQDFPAITIATVDGNWHTVKMTTTYPNVTPSDFSTYGTTIYVIDEGTPGQVTVTDPDAVWLHQYNYCHGIAYSPGTSAKFSSFFNDYPTHQGFYIDDVSMKVINTATATTVGSFATSFEPAHSVTYDANGSTGGSVPIDGTAYVLSDTVTVLGNTGSLIKIGYTFAGWNTATDGTGTDYGPTFTMGSVNVTLYAKWTVNTYTLTYTAGTNGSITGTTSQTVNSGSNGSAVTAVPAAGYHFVNWSDASTTNPRADTNVTSNVMVSASFAINTYTVTFNSNGGSAVANQTVAYNSTANAPTAPTKTGNTVAGWYSNIGLTSAFNFSTAITGDITLYAKWIATLTCYTAPSATGTGTITACFTGGGGAGCGFTVSQFIPLTGNAASPPAGSAPAGTFPQGLFAFTVSSCTPGSVLNFTITYPQPLPPGTQYEKYGPTSTNTTPHWYALPAVISGNTITFSITDGGLGDDDLLANNGSIVDPGGPFVPPPFVAVSGIPTLSEWALALLALLLLGFGAQRVRCRR